ncbi:hypothetical protein EIP86_004004 [Pleurotus ostreatoroseus]|nr:hypothetical protein EIP86_004004 [Pleurotus ostreatoroseus]
MSLSLDNFYSTPGASSSTRTLVDIEAPLPTSPALKGPTNSSPISSSPIPPSSSPLTGESETSPSEDQPFVVYDPNRWLPPKDFVYSRRPTRHDRSRGGVTRTPNAFLLFRACKVVGRSLEGAQQQDVSRVASGMWRAMPKFVKDAWKATARRIKREREMNVQPAVLNEVHARTRSPSKKDGRKASKSSLGGFATTPSSPVKPRGRRLSLPPPSRVTSPLRQPTPQPLQSLIPLPAQILENATANSAQSANNRFDQSGNMIQTIDPRSISFSHTVQSQPPTAPPSSISQAGTATPFLHDPVIRQNPVEQSHSHPAPLLTSCSAARAPSTLESSLPVVLESFEKILQVPGCDDLHGQANILMLMYVQRLTGSVVH